MLETVLCMDRNPHERITHKLSPHESGFAREFFQTRDGNKAPSVAWRERKVAAWRRDVLRNKEVLSIEDVNDSFKDFLDYALFEAAMSNCRYLSLVFKYNTNQNVTPVQKARELQAKVVPLTDSLVNEKIIGGQACFTTSNGFGCFIIGLYHPATLPEQDRRQTVEDLRIIVHREAAALERRRGRG